MNLLADLSILIEYIILNSTIKIEKISLRDFSISEDNNNVLKVIALIIKFVLEL